MSREQMLNTFIKPTSKRWLISLMTWLNRSIVCPGIPLLRDLPLLRNIPSIRGWCDLRKIEITEEDSKTLKNILNNNNACFVTPNHPELFTDWMMDKEISSRFYPMMAHWASHDNVNGMGKFMQKFWLANNLIAQIPGNTAESVQYSIDTASTGTPVLLHPEGGVQWHSDHLNHFYNGAAQMALDIVKNDANRQTYIVPIVWKLTFIKDESKHLHQEINLIEKRLNIASTATFSLAERIKLLYTEVLHQRAQQFQCEVKRHGSYFDQQDSYLNQLIDKINHIVDCPPQQDAEARAQECLKQIRLFSKNGNEISRQDKRCQKEIARLLRTTRNMYSQLIWQQEQISENLKRLRCDLLKHNFFDVLHAIVPQPVGPRYGYVAVPKPYNINQALANNPDISAQMIIEEIKEDMQNTLDKLINDHCTNHKRPTFHNPFLSS